MRFIFKRDYRIRYKDGVIRDYFAGDFADSLKYDKIMVLVRRKILVPLEDRVHAKRVQST
jgi:hypothetical protein